MQHVGVAVIIGSAGSGWVQQRLLASLCFQLSSSPGNQLRLRGEGDKGPKKGPAGDLYIGVKVEWLGRWHFRALPSKAVTGLRARGLRHLYGEPNQRV